MCFVVIPKHGNEEVEEMPTKVVDMLGEFYNILLDNVPDGLPPVRKISHRMDLMLGANL